MSESLGDLRGTIGFDVDTKALADLTKALQGVSASTDKLTAGMGGQDKAAASANAAQQGLAKGAQALAAGITAAGAAIGVATQAASAYDAAMAEVATLTPDVADNMAGFKEEVLGVSQALGQDAVQATKGLYNAISAGVPTNNAVDFLATAGQAAVAGVSDINTAVGALTVGLNAYNLDATEADRVSDALFTTVKLGVTTFGELGSKFGGVAGIASSSGASIEETLASLAQITTKGFGTAEAVTGLKAAFVSLSNPMVDAALKAKGFANGAEAVKEIGLQGVFEAIREEADATNTPLIKMVGSSEAVNAILATTGENAAGARAKLDEFGRTTGATAAAFDLINETPAQRMAVFRESVNAAKIALGDAFLPVLSSLLDVMTPVIQKTTQFIQSVLAPMGEAFSDMPGPVRALIAVLVAGVGVLASLVTAGAAAVAFLGPLASAFTGGGVAAGAFSAVVGAAGAAVAALALPVTLVVGTVVALGLAVSSANKQVEEAAQAATDAGGGYRDYLEAMAATRAESGALARGNMAVRDTFKEAGDELLILKDRTGAAFGAAGDAVSGFFAKFTGGDKSAEEIAKATEAAKQNKATIIDATEAWIQYGTNIDPAVESSDQYQLAQAELNEAFRSGKIDQAEYRTAMLEAADAASIAAGGAHVLTEAQQKQSERNRDLIESYAETAAGMGDAARQSDAYKNVQASLADQIAQGKISMDDAKLAIEAVAGAYERQEESARNALLAYADSTLQLDDATLSNAALRDEIDALAEAQAAGSMSTDQAREALSQWVAEAQSASQLAPQLSGALQSFGVSQVEPDSAAAKDAQKTVDSGDGERAKIISETLQAEHKFYDDLAATKAANEQRLLEAQQKANEDIAKANEKAAEAETDKQREAAAKSIAAAQEAAAERLATTQTENAQRLSDLQNSYASEQEARREAIAQASLDQVNAMLRLGTITEGQAQIIFGSLKEAFPGAELFDASAQAALSYNATFGRAIQGSVEDAVNLGAAIQNIPSSLDEAEAQQAEYTAASVAAYETAKAAVASGAEAHVVATDQVLAANGMRMAGETALTEATLGATGERQSAYDVELAGVGAQTAGILTHDETKRASQLQTTETVTRAEADATGAREGAASRAQSAAGDIVASNQRIQGEAATTGSVVASSVGSIGDSYETAANGVRSGAEGIVTETGKANTALGTLGSNVPRSIAPATGAMQALGVETANAAAIAEDVASTRVDAEEGAAEAAVDAGDTTAESFQLITEEGEVATAAVLELKKALESLPPHVEATYKLLGIQQAQTDLQALTRDLDMATGTWTLTVKAGYSPDDPRGPMRPVGSIQLQHDVEDAIAAAAPGVHLAGTYTGVGGMAWSGTGLAVTDSLSDLRNLTRDPFNVSLDATVGEALQLLLYDADYEAAALQAAQDELARLGEEADKAAAKLALAQQALDGFTPRVVKEINEFFGGAFQSALGGASGALGAAIDAALASASLSDQDPALRELLNSFRDMFQLDASFFGDYGILDPETLLPFSSLDEARARLAKLFAGTPEQREQARDLWETLSSGLETAFKSASQQGIDALWAYRDALGPEGEKIEGEFLKIEAAIKGAQDQLAEALKDETGEVETQLEIYDRLASLVAERAKLEEEARKAIEQANKELERQIKERQKLAEEAEKSAHDQVMDLLDDEIDRRDAAYERELRQLEKLRDSTEADIKFRIEQERKAHEERLKQIEAEVGANQARIDAEKERLDEAKLLLDIFEGGLRALTADEADLLRSLGIDPDTLAQANKGLSQTKRLIDLINETIADLPSERAYVTLTEKQKQALQEALDQGLIPDDKKRLVEVALAGGRVRGDTIREMLEKAAKGLKDELTVEEDRLKLAEDRLKALEAENKLADMRNKSEREAVKQAIEDEKARFEQFQENQRQRLAGMDAQIDLLKEEHKLEMDAIAAARDAEKDRHDARMEQLQREYALQLLSLGKSPEEVARILQEQAERAAKIAEEAQARLQAILAEAEARRKAAENENAIIGGGGLTKGGGLTNPPGAPVPGQPGPGIPGPGPGEPITTDWLDAITDSAAGAGRALQSGFFDPAVAGMRELMLVASQTNSAMMSLPLTNGVLASALSKGSRVDIEQSTDNRRITGNTFVFGQDPQTDDAILDALGVTY